MCKLAATMKSCLCVVFLILFSKVIFASGGQLTVVKVESNVNENGAAAEASTTKIPEDSFRTPVVTEVENGALMPLAESRNKRPASANVTRTDDKIEHNVTQKSRMMNITQNESANKDPTKDHVERRILMQGSMVQPLDTILTEAAKEDSTKNQVESNILRPVWMDEPLDSTAKLGNPKNEKKAEFVQVTFGDNLNNTITIEAPSTEATDSHNKVEDTTKEQILVLQTQVNETRIPPTNLGYKTRDTTNTSDDIWPTLVNLSNHVMTSSIDIANRISKDAADLSLTQPVDLSFKSQASRVESKNAHKSFKHMLSLSLKSGHNTRLNIWGTTQRPIKYKPRRHPKGRRYRYPYRRSC